MKSKQLQVLKSGERTNAEGKPVRNRILLSVSDAEYRKIRHHLEYLDLRSHLNLHEPREKLRFVYFLNHGMASFVVAMPGGRDVEAGVVGYEGAVGAALAVGLVRSPLRVMMQVGGDGFRISAQALQAALPSVPDLQMRLCRYAVLQGMQVAQTAGCNRLHDVGHRLARWLLMAQDRTDSASVFITHDFLAIMLGTDRPSVTIAAGALQQKNVIRYRRGSVEILNRKKLEACACECYRVIQSLNGQLGLE